MEDVIIQRVAVSCLIVATGAFVWFMWDMSKQSKKHAMLTSEYTQFILDRMKVQDLEDRWSNGPD